MSIGQDRLSNSKWGVFTHFLHSGTPEEWLARTSTLDTDKIAETLHSVGASYYFITIMQGNKYMLAPNATYDKITGYKPGEACAKRDCIADLIKSLDKYGIDLYLYYTGDGPHLDKQAGTAMGYYDVDGMWQYNESINDYEPKPKFLQVDEAFVTKWASVLEEYAVRYGDKIKGWWVDGCYDCIGYTPQLTDIYKKAARKGNPNGIITFNNGVENALQKWGDADFTPGERNDFLLYPKSRFIEGAQVHFLIPMGINPDRSDRADWRRKGLFQSKETVARYIKKVNETGGAVTLDIFIGENGEFDEDQLDALKYINEYTK